MQRVALAVGYNGANYYGLQRQSDASGKPTIEAELQQALVAAGAMASAGAAVLYKVNWTRTSRTDKGVSAACNVLAFDAPSSVLRAGAAGGGGSSGARAAGDRPEEAPPAAVAAMNAALPPPIRVWGLARAEAGFDARRAAVGRRYEYLVPVWALDPAVGKPRASQPQQQQQQQEGQRSGQPGSSAGGGGGPQAPDPAASPGGDPHAAPRSASPPAQAQAPATGAPTPTATAPPSAPTEPRPHGSTAGGQTPHASTTTTVATATTAAAAAPLSTNAERSLARAAADIAASGFALSAGELRRLNLILGVFVGEHCFHNFTSERADDPQQLRRTIHRAYAEGPVLLDGAGGEVAGGGPGEHTSGAAAEGGSAAGGRAEVVTTGAEDGGAAGGEGSAAAAAAGGGTQPPGGRVPYVRIVFVGSGFLMHQIRRMVGLALAVARRAAPPDCIRAALDPARPNLTVPTAPPTGLLMDRAFFSQAAYRSACEPPPGAAPPGAAGASAVGRAPQQARAGGGGGGGSGGVRGALDALGGAGEAFKRGVLYPAIHGAGPLEMWAFLCGLTDSAYAFRSWAKRGRPAAVPAAAGAATGSKAGPATGQAGVGAAGVGDSGGIARAPGAAAAPEAAAGSGERGGAGAEPPAALGAEGQGGGGGVMECKESMEGAVGGDEAEAGGGGNAAGAGGRGHEGGEAAGEPVGQGPEADPDEPPRKRRVVCEEGKQLS